MRIIIFPLIFFLSAVIFLSTCSSTYAYENDIGSSRIGPSSPIYFLKTIRENLENAFALTDRVKQIRQLEFATRRLREVKSLLLVNREDLIQPTLERYWFHIKWLLDKDLKDEEIILRVKESLVVHLKTLDIIYPQLSNPEAKMALRAILNRILIRVDIPLSDRIPVCNFLAREASSSALNQAEQSILKTRANECLKALL